MQACTLCVCMCVCVCVCMCVCVCVCFPDLPEISVSHSSVLVTEGDNVTVSCNGSGLPLPDVDWTISGLRSINTHMVKYTHVHARAPVKTAVGIMLN